MVTVKPLSNEDFPLFSICPYPPLKPWAMQNIEGLDNLNPAEAWKIILSKEEEPLTSEKVRELFANGSFLSKDIVQEIVVVSTNFQQESILDNGKETPVSPDLGKEDNRYLLTLLHFWQLVKTDNLRTLVVYKFYR